jgi:ketosteroid isomerase-like protein
MKTATLAVGLVIALALTINAQTASSDEKQIRDLIAKFDAGQTREIMTKDAIFWSGAYKRPVVGAEKPEPNTGEFQVSDRKPDSQRTKTTPVRIEIAKSGDLAYEFSNGELSFEMKDGRKRSTATSLLRVWRKEAGQWKIAAHFVRPHQP